MILLTLKLLIGLFLLEAIGYSIFVLIFSSGRFNAKSVKRLPKVSIIIPAYNEEKVIRKKLLSIRDLNYPKNLVETIIVDDCSSDDTVKIVKKFKGVKLILHKTRKGQTSAINTGVRNSTGDYLLISDSDTLFEKNSLINATKFLDPSVGAISGIVSHVFTDNSLFSKISNLSWLLRAPKQVAESNVDSTLPILTPFTLMSKKIWEPLNEKIIAQDLNVALRLREKGYRVICVPDCKVSIYNPGKFSQVARQRKRQVFGAIKTLQKFQGMLFNLKYGLFGLFIFPRYFYHVVLKQLVFGLICLLLLINFFFNPFVTLVYICLFILGVILSDFLIALSLVLNFRERTSIIFYSLLRLPFLFLMALVNLQALVQSVFKQETAEWQR